MEGAIGLYCLSSRTSAALATSLLRHIMAESESIADDDNDGGSLMESCSGRKMKNEVKGERKRDI